MIPPDTAPGTPVYIVYYDPEIRPLPWIHGAFLAEISRSVPGIVRLTNPNMTDADLWWESDHDIYLTRREALDRALAIAAPIQEALNQEMALLRAEADKP